MVVRAAPVHWLFDRRRALRVRAMLDFLCGDGY